MFSLSRVGPDLDILLEKLTAQIEIAFGKHRHGLMISSKACLFFFDIFSDDLFFDAFVIELFCICPGISQTFGEVYFKRYVEGEVWVSLAWVKILF